MQFDGNTTLLIALGIIALVAIVYAVRYGGSGKTKINGPFGLSVEAEGRNPAKAAKPNPQPKPEPKPEPPLADNVAVDLEDIKAGGKVAVDAEGKIKAQKIDAGKDATFRSQQPKAENNDPKAHPPA